MKPKKPKKEKNRITSFGVAHHADGTITVFPPRELKVIDGPGARRKRRKSA